PASSLSYPLESVKVGSPGSAELAKPGGTKEPRHHAPQPRPPSSRPASHPRGPGPCRRHGPPGDADVRRRPQAEPPMTEDTKVDLVRSYSSGMPGRALNQARMHHFVLDSPSGPNEALTNSEAFLAGISSCGVTLIEKHARDTGVPVTGMEVTISGLRSRADPTRFQRIDVRF